MDIFSYIAMLAKTLIYKEDKKDIFTYILLCSREHYSHPETIFRITNDVSNILIFNIQITKKKKKLYEPN